MNNRPAYIGMDLEVLALIEQKERQYQQAAHTGTRCELLQAYGKAVQYAQSNGASYEEAREWQERACALAQSGAETDPCFISCWDAAVICVQAAALARNYSFHREARELYKKAAAYLERIQDEQMQDPGVDCDVAGLLRDVYRSLADGV